MGTAAAKMEEDGSILLLFRGHSKWSFGLCGQGKKLGSAPDRITVTHINGTNIKIVYIGNMEM